MHAHTWEGGFTRDERAFGFLNRYTHGVTGQGLSGFGRRGSGSRSEVNNRTDDGPNMQGRVVSLLHDVTTFTFLILFRLRHLEGTGRKGKAKEIGGQL